MDAELIAAVILIVQVIEETLQPPNRKKAIGAATSILIPVLPAPASYRNQRALAHHW
jgi:hypothetical protein